MTNWLINTNAFFSHDFCIKKDNLTHLKAVGFSHVMSVPCTESVAMPEAVPVGGRVPNLTVWTRKYGVQVQVHVIY